MSMNNQSPEQKIREKQRIGFQAYGVKIGIEAEESVYLSEIEKRLGKILPNGFEIIGVGEADHILQIKRKAKQNDFQLFKNEVNVANSAAENEFFDFVESEIRLTIAEYAVSKVFLHAGVVTWKGEAIVIPGNSFSGKTSLVAALIKKGALYYSDEYAVLDENGNVHPFAKSLSLRGVIDEYRQVDYAAETLGGKVGVHPAMVRMILITEYDRDLEKSENEPEIFKPRLLSAGQAILEIIRQTIPIRINPKFTLQVLNKVVENAIIAKSKRGDADKFADLLLAYFEKKIVSHKSDFMTGNK